jgi:hypothetical protein
MTREFHIKGIPGLVIFVLMAAVLVLLLLAVPSVLLMVLWNAVIFEGLKGPAIHLFQGVLLAMMAAVVIKVLLQPSVEVHFRKATSEELAQLQSFVEAHHIMDETQSPVMASTETFAEQTVEIKSHK